MNNESDPPEWLKRMVPAIEALAARYEMLSQEHQIWFWVASIAGALLLIGGIGYLIYLVFRSLNVSVVRSTVARWLLLVFHRSHSLPIYDTYE